MDVEFDYFVNGVRRGFAGIDLVRENHEWVPEYRDRPFGTQYPEALRRILVENGTLNPDLTPNEKTAARMGWELRDFEEENDRLVDAKEPVSPDRSIRKEQDRTYFEKQDLEPPLQAPVHPERINRSEEPDHPDRDPTRTSPKGDAPTTHETAAKSDKH
jgi:hypothetical protein